MPTPKTRQVFKTCRVLGVGNHHGKAYWQWVAQAKVMLGRPVKPSHLRPAGRTAYSWRSCGCNAGSLPHPGRRRLLMANVADATIALWYYWW